MGNVMTSTDRAWFKKNPNSNMRLRRPVDGEVEELARRMHASAGYELALVGGKFPPPSADVEWFIMVINAGPDTLLRLLSLRTVGSDERPASEVSLYVVAIGDRVAIDNRRA